MSYNESAEMYLETVYILEKSHGHAHGTDVAKKLGVSKASVSKAMKLLKEKGLIHKETYGTITLTPKGLELSKQIYYNHRMISLYLKESLKLSDQEAADNACRMEHIISENMLECIRKYLEEKHIEVSELEEE
ncbi:metal-dependent transcriptional regulator [Acidaminobacter sp. JC074]|uniref:metal-dependent transcriptional regulator n=1 Tax=Acidaminobacter sp. JC074 TaxID=2530199 RepID=UPI001F109485|nr:metal-dependent transcriptional regulator [Acidaminobacter sp. JC074]